MGVAFAFVEFEDPLGDVLEEVTGEEGEGGSEKGGREPERKREGR